MYKRDVITHYIPLVAIHFLAYASHICEKAISSSDIIMIPIEGL